MDLNTYENFTPYEINIIAQELNEKEQIKIENKLHLAITQSYYTEAFHRTKKLKPLSKYLNKMSQKKKQQTDSDIFEIVKLLNKMYGGDIVGSTT